MGFGNASTFHSSDIPILPTTQQQSQKLCKKCQQERRPKERQIQFSTESTPLWSQFKRRKPCNCNQKKWKAYKMYYFTVSPRFNSPKSDHIHVIDIRFECNSCSHRFPLSISFTTTSFQCQYGEYMKYERWIYTEFVDMKYGQFMKGFFGFYDWFGSFIERNKKEKKILCRPNSGTYSSDLWFDLVIINLLPWDEPEPVEIEEYIPEEECKCFKSQKKV